MTKADFERMSGNEVLSHAINHLMDQYLDLNAHWTNWTPERRNLLDACRLMDRLRNSL